jgi:hypothetical protein
MYRSYVVLNIIYDIMCLFDRGKKRTWEILC